jgi:putative spermidine/putrescine transport system ATP-binding protein
MEKGKIKQAGPAREVYARPRDRYVAEFLGGQNVFSGKVESINGKSVFVDAPDARVIVVPLEGHRSVSSGERIDLAVRRDDIHLRRPGTGAREPGWNAINTRIRAIEYQGAFVKVMLDSVGEAEFVAYVSEREFFSDPFAAGDVVVAAWMAERSLLLAK